MTFLLELGFCDNKVLIDTWWNVNIKPVADNDVPFGFNRYMVECKYFSRTCLCCDTEF